jgi:hypothetical protein
MDESGSLPDTESCISQKMKEKERRFYGFLEERK